jgi:alkanesulfonate monooxygenase SsuD/methylene tetrahydromethanopterin reductase-like flavin-dependent oxidoreductase (luciferase family)
MREYLTIVRTSVRDGGCSFDGRFFTARWTYSAPRRQDMPVMISALNPRMLELAGEMADGVVLYMCAPAYIRERVIPALEAGRAKVGRTLEGFEIVAAVDTCLTSNRKAALEVYRKTVERYASLPFYRKAMDAGGFKEELDANQISEAMIDQLAAIGDERQIQEVLKRYRESGVSLPGIGPFAGHDGAAGFEATLAAAAGG